jgi:hypothetical protein
MLLLLLAACPDPTDKPSTETITEGTACVDAGIETITFTFDTCLSSSCDTLESATCEATISGETVTVTGEAVVVSEGDTCTDDCGMATATCTMPALPDTGDIQVVVGDETVPLAEFVCDSSG